METIPKVLEYDNYNGVVTIELNTDAFSILLFSLNNTSETAYSQNNKRDAKSVYDQLHDFMHPSTEV